VPPRYQFAARRQSRICAQPGRKARDCAFCDARLAQPRAGNISFQLALVNQEIENVEKTDVDDIGLGCFVIAPQGHPNPLQKAAINLLLTKSLDTSKQQKIYQDE
jgi:hypothetical protein